MDTIEKNMSELVTKKAEEATYLLRSNEFAQAVNEFKRSFGVLARDSEETLSKKANRALAAGILIPKIGELAEDSGILEEGTTANLLGKAVEVVNIASTVLSVAAAVQSMPRVKRIS